jgi:hypothetical protein
VPPNTSIEPVVVVVLAALLVVGAIAGWTWLQKQLLRSKLRRRWTRAVAAEAAAPQLLRDLGYEVVGAQVQGSYVLQIDGEDVTVPLRADYLATRADLSFVAEVKSGKLAPKLSTAATRRQLLEYLVAFEVDGVLLVDGETRRVHEVVFPLSSRRKPEVSSKGWLVLTAALVLAAVVGYLLYGR